MPRQLIEVSGRDWEAADLVLDHAIAVADTFEARSHHGVWAAGEDRHLFLSLRPEVEIGDQVPPDYDVVLRGTLSEPVRLELHQLQESLAWDFRLLDGERTVYHWGPGDHGRARFPAEAAARLSSQLDQQGLQWNATSAAAWRDVCSKWRTAAVTAETSDNESARVLNDPDDPAATGAPFGSLVDALLEGFAHRAPPHRGTPFAPRAQLVAARYRPVADARLQYAPTRPPTAFWREVVARRARPGSPFSVSTYAGDATDQALTAALGAGGGHRLRRITLASPQPVGRPTRRASPGRARP